jgi:hypothetical protein
MNAPSSTTTFRWAGYLWQGVGQDDVDVDFVKSWLAFYGSYQLTYRLREIADKDLGPEQHPASQPAGW